jgi:hypothetical protein
MSDAANALQKAIYETLADDAALTALVGTAGIFDRRLTGKPMPYTCHRRYLDERLRA